MQNERLQPGRVNSIEHNSLTDRGQKINTFNTRLIFSLIGVLLWLGLGQVSYALSLNEAQKLNASDPAGGDFFGASVSVSGDTAVIGVHFDDDNGSASGSAYVFMRNGAGVWHEQQKLNTSDGAVDDFFGWSVSVSGDTAVIGALFDDDNGSRSGSAYVFVRDGTGVWREQQKLNASDAAVDDFFGASVSVSGDSAVIGARGDDDNGSRSGSAYVFVRDGTGVWREQQKLNASDAAEGDQFGFSASVSGDTAVIGADRNGDNGTNSGSAYVFVRDGTGVWREQQKLNASDAAEGDQFGFSASVSGDTAVIGAVQDDDSGSGSGSAYVFVRDGTGAWREQQKLNASDAAVNDVFGWSLSTSGDTAVIGAWGDDDNGARSGSAYVFLRDGAGLWSEKQKLNASDGAVNDRFGGSVSVSGDTAVISAHLDDDNRFDSGSAYVFDISSDLRVTLNYYADINPHHCPNRISTGVSSGQTVSIALAGQPGLSVWKIKAHTIRLENQYRAVSFFRQDKILNHERQYSNNPNECFTSGVDGRKDLILNFNKADVLAAMRTKLGRALQVNDTVELNLTGELRDGRLIKASDFLNVRVVVN